CRGDVMSNDPSGSRRKMTTRGPPRSSGVTTHSALPSRSRSPAATNPPDVKFASPNGSVGGTRVLPSLPLTTAIWVFTPGPVTRTVSITPSPSKSPVAARTPPANPGNGATGPPTGWSVPAWYCWAAPPAAPETERLDTTGGGPGGGSSGGGGGGRDEVGRRGARRPRGCGRRDVRRRHPARRDCRDRGVGGDEERHRGAAEGDRGGPGEPGPGDRHRRPAGERTGRRADPRH